MTMEAPHEAQSFGEVLVRLLKSKRFYEKGRYGRLVDAWREVVGEAIAARTSIRAFEHGRLTVEVADAVLLHELSGFMREALLEELRRRPGGEDVAELRFRLGHDEAR
jgi:predicted nucleic acid-binding Zn ribbon protein